ncbi:MAG: hypothetical protein EKK61_03745 [Rickettsiales bacterium]|nr:MAG: hypothetical protein EKK61_03745 [Rickettsiales bacterium]
MAESKINGKLEVNIKIDITLNYQEAQALLQITRYNTNSFLEGFYNKLGKSYLEPYQDGVKSLFSTLRGQLPDTLNKAREINIQIEELKSKFNK